MSDFNLNNSLYDDALSNVLGFIKVGDQEENFDLNHLAENVGLQAYLESSESHIFFDILLVQKKGDLKAVKDRLIEKWKSTFDDNYEEATGTEAKSIVEITLKWKLDNDRRKEEWKSVCKEDQQEILHGHNDK